MGAMVSQIISFTTVYSTVYSGADQRKKSELRVTGLCAGNSPVTGEFPAQMASNAFRFDDVIMKQPEPCGHSVGYTDHKQQDCNRHSGKVTIDIIRRNIPVTCQKKDYSIPFALVFNRMQYSHLASCPFPCSATKTRVMHDKIPTCTLFELYMRI